jgi:RimJ/RimL family protein N-acetyltransferase
MNAPEQIETARLILHRPRQEDGQEIFDRYAGDPEVTRYLAWPRHTSITDTELFLKFSNYEWTRWSVGPFLVRLRGSNTLVGSTGLAMESSTEASTGYVFARDVWGRGYASESLRAMIGLARQFGVRRLYALCHTEHQPSARVLEKGGFMRQGILAEHITFPNLGVAKPRDVFCYSIDPCGVRGREEPKFED